MNRIKMVLASMHMKKQNKSNNIGAASSCLHAQRTAAGPLVVARVLASYKYY